MMDDKTYEAFKSDVNPNITFKLNTATTVEGGLNTTGTLTMAGSPKSIQMRPEIKIMPDGSVQIKGSQKINMKDYKMTPPKAVMGTIKVAPDVTVIYDLILIP
jgi:polyisoprenoid-binding protein YceI